MKLTTVLSALFASGTVLAASVPNGNSVNLPRTSAELVRRDSGSQARSQEKTDVNETKDSTNALDSFFDELFHPSTKENQATSQLDRRNAITDFLGNIVDSVSPETVDYNQMIGYGFNVTAHFVTSVDLNAAIVDGIDWVSKKVASVEGIPGAMIIQTFFTALKTLVSKADLNSWASSILSFTGHLITSFDFNYAIKVAVQTIKKFISTMMLS